METLRMIATKQAKTLAKRERYACLLETFEKEVFTSEKEKVGFLKEVRLLLKDGRIPTPCLYPSNLLCLYRVQLKNTGSGNITMLLIGLLDQLGFTPACPSLWKVIYKRLAIDELSTLLFILNKTQGEELYQFVGHSYLFKMTKEEMKCLKALIELSEAYAMVQRKGNYILPVTEKNVDSIEKKIEEGQFEYSFSLS